MSLWNFPGLIDTNKGKIISTGGSVYDKPAYTEEFRTEAVKQVTERGYGVREVSERLGI